MSALVEFSIRSEAFHLGKALSRPESMYLELERVVPTGEQAMPFVWATGSDHERFERHVRERPEVREFTRLDVVDAHRLYRIEWASPPLDLLNGIAEAEGTVLEARGDDQWLFRVRFASHDRLSQFHTYCGEAGLPLTIERMSTATGGPNARRRFGITREQREAITMALDRGYFETPSQVGLDALAAELGISRQAVSNRIRRANRAIIQTVLESTTHRD
jgi:predicted DNA binding protein